MRGCKCIPSLTCRSATVHDYAIDNWTLGILCYELLYGAPPFEVESQVDTLKGMEAHETSI